MRKIISNTSTSQQENIVMSSSLTIYLEQLQDRVPIVSDKAIVDLVNGIQVSQHIFGYRNNRGWFGNLIDKLDGSDDKRRLILDDNLITGQEALYNLVKELVDKLQISQATLIVTQNSLMEARDAIRNLKQGAQIQEEALLQLNDQLYSLAQKVGVHLSNHETRIRRLEVQVAAREDFNRIVKAWVAQTTYTQLPWTMQVALLAREVFSSSVVMYELETNDTKYRQDLVNEILAYSKQLPSNQLPSSVDSLGDLLDRSWKEIKNNDDLELLAGLLEVRSVPMQRLVNTPHLFVIGTTLELAKLPEPEEARPLKPGRSAIAICRDQIDIIDRTTDPKKFVTSVVEETANDCLAMISNNFEK